MDSSVWIDYFNGSSTGETELLDQLLATDVVATGDLILAEVLQGFRDDAHFAAAQRALDVLPTFDLLGRERAYRAAGRYREGSFVHFGLPSSRPVDVRFSRIQRFVGHIAVALIRWCITLTSAG